MKKFVLMFLAAVLSLAYLGCVQTPSPAQTQPPADIPLDTEHGIADQSRLYGMCYLLEERNYRGSSFSVEEDAATEIELIANLGSKFVRHWMHFTQLLEDPETLDEAACADMHAILAETEKHGIKYTGVMNNRDNNVSASEFDNSFGTKYNDGDFSQGLLVQVDGNGNVRVIRLNNEHRTVIKQPWIIHYPTADKSHLAAYDNKTRAKNAVAPVFAADAQFRATITPTKASFEWDAATDDDMVHYYRINLFCDGQQCAVYYVATFTYRYDSADEMPKTLSFEKEGTFEDGVYTANILAVDIWKAASAPLAATVS